jgi:DNA end-binding protein Ku
VRAAVRNDCLWAIVEFGLVKRQGIAMPASRPVWKGQLRLSLVSIPVELFAATRPNARPVFHQIHEPSGKRIHYEKVVEGVGPVDRDEIMKGFEYDKGDYVLLSDEEIDAVRLDTRKTLELTQFVKAGEIDPLYFDRPYYVVPSDDLAEDAFRVIRDALRQTARIGLGQLAMRGQEYLVALKPTGTGLLLETLRYESAIRKADPFFSEISGAKADPELLEVATALIDKKTAPFNAGAFKDHYQQALRELIEEKLKAKGRKITPPKEREERAATGSNVIDLMSALKKSLEGGGKAPEPATRSTARPARKPAAKRTAAKSASRKKAS